MPVLIPFFQENGLDMQQVLLLQAAFSTSLILFEIPSGYFADVIGRKFSLVIGSAFGAIGFAFYAYAYTFNDFLLVEIILGVGGSLISGADSALLYDTLLEIEEEEKYTQYAGRLGSVANFSEGIAAIIGGQLALISLRTPLYFEALLVAFCVPVALTLVEPARHKLKQTEKTASKASCASFDMRCTATPRSNGSSCTHHSWAYRPSPSSGSSSPICRPQSFPCAILASPGRSYNFRSASLPFWPIASSAL